MAHDIDVVYSTLQSHGTNPYNTIVKSQHLVLKEYQET